MTFTVTYDVTSHDWRDIALSASKLALGYTALAEHDKSLADEFWDYAAPAIHARMAQCDELEKYSLEDFFPRYAGIWPVQTFLDRRQEIEADIAEQEAARAEAHNDDMRASERRHGEAA